MAVPKSVMKITKDGVKFVSNVEKVNYTIQELSQAALKDVAKFLRKVIKKTVPVDQGVLRKNVGTWVRKDKSGMPRLQVGVYDRQRARQKGYTYAYHAHLIEFGTVKARPQPFLRPSVMDNIDEIRRIQGQYLSAIADENKAMGLIDENEEVADD